jgi:hypothetical protein
MIRYNDNIGDYQFKSIKKAEPLLTLPKVIPPQLILKEPIF